MNNVSLKQPINTPIPPKMLSKMELNLLGIPLDNFNIVDTLDDLKKTPPNIIIATCKTSVKFIQNYFREQQLNKRESYVMGLGTYVQLHYDPRTKVEILKPFNVQFKNIYRHYNGQDLTNKSLLVFRTGGIGDLLFIQPNLIELKKRYPSCTIKFACGPQYQAMVDEWDCIDEVLDLPFNFQHLIKSDYHCVFEGVIERCKMSEKICSYNLFSKWMGLDLDNNLLIPKQEPNYDLVEKNKKVLEELGLKENDFILVQMRASSPIRTPRPDMWIKLINLLTEKGHNVLLTDIPRNTPTLNDFILKLKDKDKVKNFSKYSESIGDTIAVTYLSKLVIATDSALMHIAESLEKKSFGIYGPFPGNVRLSTYKNCDWIDVKKDCAPCFIHSEKPCKYSTNGYPTCYDKIDFNESIERIERLLNV